MSKSPRSKPGIDTKRGKFNKHDVEYLAGHFIIQLEQRGADPKPLLAKVLGRRKTRIIARYENHWIYLRVLDDKGDTDRRMDIIALTEKLGKVNGIRWAEPDLVLKAAVVPNDPMLVAGHVEEQWGLKCINMFDAWNIQTLDDSVVIGLLDSGIPLTGEPTGGIPPHDDLDGYSTHPDFDGKRFIAGKNYVPESDGTIGTSLNDTSGHGTSMAGIIAAVEDNSEGLAGVNWGSPVYVSRVLDAGNIGTIGFMLQGVQDTLEYARDNDKKAVFNFCASIDLGGLLDVVIFTESIFPLFESIIDADAIICIAAGNNYTPGKAMPYLEYPAKLGVDLLKFATHTIVVGAIAEDLSMWEDSGRGVTDMVFAPGKSVGTTHYLAGVGYYQKEHGTSIATSHVSALAALLWSKAPGKTATQIVCCVKCTAKEPSRGAGYRIIDAFAALDAV